MKKLIAAILVLSALPVQAQDTNRSPYKVNIALDLGISVAGDHFWTDIIAGAVLGIGMGLLVPWMHEPSTSTGVAVGPLVTPDGGFGAVLTFR